jgi:hypothetical protein
MRCGVHTTEYGEISVPKKIKKNLKKISQDSQKYNTHSESDSDANYTF